MLNKKISDMFSSVEGGCVFDRINRYISENNMYGRILSGALVGFSGGPDSVMLLSYLYEMRQRGADFSIVACHINHMIRGAAADADEIAARAFADELGIEFISKSIDVPALSAELSLGTEECARNVRYSTFLDIIRGRNDINYILTAHNAGDNVETAIFNILRGAGALGASGINPIRGNVLRPMLSVSKSDIVSLLDRFEIPYSIDKTNLESEYTRNFIRNEVCKKLSERFPTYERSIFRFTENMRDCYEYIAEQAKAFISEHSVIRSTELSALNTALLSEVLSILSEERISRDTVIKIKSLLKSESFSYNLPGGRIFICERGVCTVSIGSEISKIDFRYDLKKGLNEFSEFSSVIYISDEPLPKTYTNIYKISIQERIPFDIIYGDVYVRSRAEGDTIYYNGITHKIKKMFCDRKIPNSKKSLIPIFCDDEGPLFVPGYHVRGDGGEAERYLYVYILDDEDRPQDRFFTGRDFS